MSGPFPIGLVALFEIAREITESAVDRRHGAKLLLATLCFIGLRCGGIGDLRGALASRMGARAAGRIGRFQTDRKRLARLRARDEAAARALGRREILAPLPCPAARRT